MKALFFLGSAAILGTAAMFAVLSITTTASAQDNFESTLDHFKRTQPKPVVDFIQRSVDCNHWAGEEPYDKAHAAEIVRAERRLCCDVLDHDEAALRHRYRANHRVLNALDKVKDLVS